MKEQAIINYNRIAEAIDYISQNFKNHPNLDEVAEKVHISPYHFQRMFSNWAGVSPKKFLEYISIEYAKNILKISRPPYLMRLLKQGFRVQDGFTTYLLKLKE